MPDVGLNSLFSAEKDALLPTKDSEHRDAQIATPMKAGQHPRPFAIPTRLTGLDAMLELNSNFGFTRSWGQRDGPSTYFKIADDGTPVPCSKDEIKDRLANRFVLETSENGVKKIDAFTYWNTHRERREYDLVIYDPERRCAHGGARVLNLYSGLSRNARRGCWSLMRRHLFKVICDSNPELFRYLLCWFAHLIQHPGTAPGTVIVLMSTAEGSGKTTVTDWLVEILGKHAASFNTPEQLLGRFNGHLAVVSLIVVSEPSFAGNHGDSRKLKSMITDKMWHIEVKYQRSYSIANIAHIVITTNEPWAVAAGHNARRFLVLDVNTSRVHDHDYFRDLYQQAYNGGIEAMLYALQRLDISKFNPAADLPITDALKAQQEHSAESHVIWALDLTDGWNTPTAHILFGGAVATDDLYESYQCHAKAQGIRRPMTFITFGKWLASLGMASTTVTHLQTKRRGWVLPDAATFNLAVKKAAGMY